MTRDNHKFPCSNHKTNGKSHFNNIKHQPWQWTLIAWQGGSKKTCSSMPFITTGHLVSIEHLQQGPYIHLICHKNACNLSGKHDAMGHYPVGPWKKKRWTPVEVESLLHLYQKKIPIKIMAQIFNVSHNAISKALQRYSIHHSHILENKIDAPYENIHRTLQWMNKNYLLFYDIIHGSPDKSTQVIATNKILYKNNFKVLSPLQVEVLLFRIAMNHRLHSS